VTALRRSRRTGFTLIEVMIALVIFGLITLNLSMVAKASSAAYGTGVFSSVLEDQADLTMDRLSLALMSSSAKQLQPIPPVPNSTPTINFQESLGVQEGQIVLGDPEQIEFVPGVDGGPGQIVWRENPGAPNERSAVWTSWVPLLQGNEKNPDKAELANGVDDNGNGLVDEKGLAFEPQGAKVGIFLTLERTNSQGQKFVKTRQTVVTCRN